ncbi:hypothetical protein BVRB_1g022610 [Beta vulgaris subsp. vulgaris]|uniref:BED-type domain-containing protein n=1 Tax=Beta vulgaris subsp. vulgaris TaxID=3555 RepID=A0A0J8E8Z1_BETVV|nr:hypothetical protein BVRB_1g022610 [Beta vulgaris subsp. vulgaris]
MADEDFKEQIELSSEAEEEIDSTPTNANKKKFDTKKPRVLLTGKKRQRRLTSYIWMHFQFLKEPDENGNLVCKCKKCGQSYNADSKMGTGNLIRHVKNCKMRSFRDVGQMILEKSSSGLEHRIAKFDPDFFRELLSLTIVQHDLPFQFVDTFMAVAVVLDPRFKLQCVHWSFKRVYGDSFEYEFEFSKVKDKLKELYEVYAASYAASHASSSKNMAAHGESGVVGVSSSDDLMTDFDCFSAEQSTVTAKSDMELYFEEHIIPRTTNIDLLSYWEGNKVRYPVLAQLAKDVLAVPISTMASESAFSTGGRVLDCFRSSLKPSTVEGIICLRDWSFGEAKMDPQLDALCGAVMKLKVEDEVDEVPIQSPSLSVNLESPRESTSTMFV